MNRCSSRIACNEQSLEDVMLEILGYEGDAVERLSVLPTKILCYPKDLDDVRRIVGAAR